MKILLVDDARSVVQVMTSRLNSYGYEVVHAANGQQAVELFATLCPDLILMDIEMPVMNGFVATHKIRDIEATQEWAWTPIIFLTSSDTVQNLITAIEAGGDDFMSKFVAEPVLQAKMQAMSRIAGLRQRLSQANAKLQNIADHDGLTGLLNRRSMDRLVDQGWSGAVQAAVQASNRQGLSVNAFAARYGGEEFAVTLPGAAGPACAQLAQAIVQAVHGLRIPHERNADWGITTISVGGTWLEAASGEVKHVFRQADEKLYLAKERGRNRAEW